MIYKLVSAALKIILAIGKGLIVAIPELLKSIPQIIDAVVRAFGDFLKPVMDIGKNIIEGIKKGISNAWNSLVNWFKGLFGDLIGIAKKILGIASPSKVFKKIGGFTAEGFGAGFEDEFAKVKDDMEDALNFDDASVGINASIRKVGAGAAGGAFGGTSIGNININIDGAKYSDEQSLAAAVALEIQNMTDRRAAVYA
jgi:phage-related protein